MVRSSSLELDFFRLEKKDSAGAKPPVFKRRRSFRDIQGVITKMNPELVKSVIANGKSSVPVPSTPNLHCGSENNAPLTIFYNGIVTVFNVSPNQAQDVLKVAEEKDSHSTNLLESLCGDLPISRKNSLQRFLEKRKERLTTLPSYYFPSENCYSCQSPFSSKY